MRIGFSTGCLYGSVKDINSNEVVNFIANISKDVIEISCLDISALNGIKLIKPEILNQFSFKSFHAPAIGFEYKNNKETKSLFKEITSLHIKHNFDIVVIHPDKITDLDLVSKYLGKLPLAIENMNSAKRTGRNIEELSQILEKYEFKVLLDLLHIHSVDTTMHLVKDIEEKYKDRISAIHLSGEDMMREGRGVHLPLYLTKQVKIVEAIPSKNLPVIIESPVNSLEKLRLEYEYIKRLTGC